MNHTLCPLTEVPHTGATTVEFFGRPTLVVVHILCRYLPPAATVRTKKRLQFDRRDSDLNDKPDWFLLVLPLGKTLVLLGGNAPFFEPAVVCAYLDDTIEPRKHPIDPLERVRHRADIELKSTLLNGIGAYDTAPDSTALEERGRAIRRHCDRFEAARGNAPYFGGEDFSIGDAAFDPVFWILRGVIDVIDGLTFSRAVAKGSAWHRQRMHRESDCSAVCDRYADRLRSLLRARTFARSRRMPTDGLLDITTVR